MSYHITLNRWDGSDLESVVPKMARVFRLDVEEAHGIVAGLAQGNAWQFHHQVSNQQSEMAENYLSALGFEVTRHPVAAYWEKEDDRDAEQAPEVAAPPAPKKGFLGKLKEILTKKR